MPRPLALACCLLLAAPAAAQQRDAPAGKARVTGRAIAADNGSPLAGARIILEATRLLDTPLYSLHRSATTDGSGVFDFTGLPFGDYILRTTKTGYLPRTSGRNTITGGTAVMVRDRQPVSTVTVTLTRGGAIGGRIVDTYGEPVARVQVQAQRYQYASDGSRGASPTGTTDVTDDLGQFRVFGLPAGDFILVATASTGALPPPGLPLMITGARATTAPTYFPGTTDAGQAQIVSLAAGSEANVEFVLSTAPLVRVTGTVISSSGAPAAGQPVGLRTITADMVATHPGVMTAADGTFTLERVVPGNYRLDVGGLRNPGGEIASVPVTVGSEDVAVSVVTTLGATIRGRVVVEGGPRPASIDIRAHPAESGGAYMRRAGDQATVSPGGSFTLTGLTGSVLLTAVSDGWLVKSVTIDGRESVDEPIDTAGRDVLSGVTVVVTNRLATVAGRVTDDRGQPLPNHMVVLLRTDPTAMIRQRLRSIQTDGDGRFTIDALRPGAYAAGAVADIEANSFYSPDFQERLRANGLRVDLSEGQTINVSMTLTRGLP